jgi:hypothetical protein
MEYRPSIQDRQSQRPSYTLIINTAFPDECGGGKVHFYFRGWHLYLDRSYTSALDGNVMGRGILLQCVRQNIRIKRWYLRPWSINNVSRAWLATKMPSQPSVTEIRLNNITTCLTRAAITYEILANSFKTPFSDAICNTIQSLLRCIQASTLLDKFVHGETQCCLRQ